jgi:hypothetical protein
MRYIEADIWLALKARIDALITNPALIAFEPGETIEPPRDLAGPLPYILASDVRNDGVRVGIDASLQTKSGTLMLAIQWPIVRSVTHTQLLQLAGSVAAHFPADLRMKKGATCLRVTRDADCMQPYRESANHVVIVRILWSTT